MESRAAMRGRQRLLHAVPGQHDRGERKHKVQSQRIDRGRNGCGEAVATVLNEQEQVHGGLDWEREKNSSEMPTGARAGRLWGDRVVVLLIGTAGLEQGFKIVLLDFLADHLLHGLRLEHLVRLLLRAQLDQERLVDTLQGRHLRVLRRVSGMAHRLQVGDVLLPLLRVGADSAEGLERGRVCCIAKISAGSLNAIVRCPRGSSWL